MGACGSIGLLLALAQRDARPGRARPLRWVALVAVLAVTALWTFAQPMEMRGVGRLG
jgi:hypothetical protein